MFKHEVDENQKVDKDIEFVKNMKMRMRLLMAIIMMILIFLMKMILIFLMKMMTLKAIITTILMI